MSKIGLDAAELKQQILDSIPLYTKYGVGIQLVVIEQAIRSAEDRVERDLDMFITPRTVWCRPDQTEPEDPEDNTFLLPALTKPTNWFQGQRQGALKLPKLPARKIERVTIHTFGPFKEPFDIPLDRTRLEGNGMLYFVPGVMGTIFPLSSYLSSYLVHDGYRIPGGVEVKYQAGLTPRMLKNDFATVGTMVRTLAQIEVFVFLQALIAPGTQKEQLAQDNLGNTIEYVQRHLYGPLAGEIKALVALYESMLRSMRSNVMSVRIFQ